MLRLLKNLFRRPAVLAEYYARQNATDAKAVNQARRAELEAKALREWIELIARERRVLRKAIEDSCEGFIGPDENMLFAVVDHLAGIAGKGSKYLAAVEADCAHTIEVEMAAAQRQANGGNQHVDE